MGRRRIRATGPSGGEAITQTIGEGLDELRADFGGAKYENLARIKGIYDPDNVFHRNANIRPA